MKHVLGIYTSGKLTKQINLNDFPEFLKGEPVFLGRRESCHICIPQETISREHAYITFDGKKVYITDNNSTNGISVGGKRKQQVELAENVRVHLNGEGEHDTVVIYFKFPESEEKNSKETPVQKNRVSLEASGEVKGNKNNETQGRKGKTVLRRLVAAMADWTLVMFMCVGFGGIVALVFGLGGIMKLVLAVGILSIIWLYFSLSESGTNGATFGKMICSLKVIDKNGKNLTFRKATIRLILKIPSLLTLLLPVFGKGRCLHDVIAKTYVTEFDKYSKFIEAEQA